MGQTDIDRPHAAETEYLTPRLSTAGIKVWPAWMRLLMPDFGDVFARS